MAVEHSDANQIVAIRLPNQLREEVEAVARRDANKLSATLRRLISLGLRAERRSAEQ
jgi:hypothetical protein